MDVSVKHNGLDISEYVIQYEREHKICTGIGMLELEVAYTYPGSFDPWDEITIYENGEKSGQYFVSTASEGQPNSTIAISAQDNSKRLSDYFISDSYTIDYPSYNRFWIEYFLQEVGISYTFLTSEVGSLLSNSTALGLMTAYEQIMMLVQLSGWYFTFNYDGRMLIGKASSSFGSRKGTYGNNDIIEISLEKSDRMLRNRVVVWGKGDPETEQWIFADVSKPTKWDYDRRDKRTIVIANSNIRKTVDAFSLANKALLEFANITVEKRVQLVGAKNLVVGDIVGLRNPVYTGAGKVTTFGTSMSKNGLVTNLILDERCPRLFGFFDIGGYVYVGTYGSGVWRKHILPQSWSGSGLLGFASGLYSASGWYDYSAGLVDLNVTDLHINSALLTCVTAAGEAYHSLEDETPWEEINFQGQYVNMSGEPIVMAGGVTDLTVYSGLMARACIIDRDTNSIRLAVDTRSGINYGDFLMETDPLSPILYGMFSPVTSGQDVLSLMVPSGTSLSGFRSWVIDANGYDGSVKESFPVGVSGNYDFMVFDIDNDGTTDYLSAMSLGSGLLPLVEYSYYQGDGDGEDSMYDTPYIALMPYSGYPSPVLQSFEYVAETISTPYNIYDHTLSGNSFVVCRSTGGATSTMKVMHTVIQSGMALVKRVTSHTAIAGNWEYLGGQQLGDNSFRCIVLNSSTNAMEAWDLTINLSGSISGSVSRTVLNANVMNGLGGGFGRKDLTHGDYLYICTYVLTSPSNGFEWYLGRINLYTGAAETKLILTANGTGTGAGKFQYLDPQIAMCTYGENDVAAFVGYRRVDYFSVAPTSRYKCYGARLVGFGGTGSSDEMFDWTGAGYSAAFMTTALSSARNFNNNEFFGYFRWTNTVVGATAVDLGGTFTAYDNATPMPDGFNVGLSSAQHLGPYAGGMVKIPSLSPMFYNCDTVTGELSELTYPVEYNLLSFIGTDTDSGERFFEATNTTTSTAEIIAITTGGGVTRRTISPVGGIERMVGNYLCGGSAVYMRRSLNMLYPKYYILQRDNYDFNVVKSGIFRERIEISNYAPIVTMDRRVSSLQTYYISMDGQVTTSVNPSISGYTMSGINPSGSLFTLGVTGDDMRYAGFETTTESGYPQNLYVVFSGQIGSIDLADLSTMSGIYSTPSGYVKRVEISNFVFPDQYVFAAISGYIPSGVAGSGWGFVQRDPNSGGEWADYSAGYPQARTTIIRYDDII